LYYDLNEEAIAKAIEKSGRIMDDGMIEELSHVYDYAYYNNYADYWTTAQAKKDWKFEEIKD